MVFVWISLAVVLLVLLASLVCFFLVFYNPKSKPMEPDQYELPKGEAYVPHHDTILKWMQMTRNHPCETFTVPSFDGLTLYGRYYEYAPGAPVEIMFHGYRGTAERDLSGGVARCFALGRSALLVDQRSAGRSGGRIITFGIREYRDCLTWAEFASRHFGPEVKLHLTGISMGASSVIMAAAHPLPENVVCVLADCGFTSPKEIICKVIRDLKLPLALYPTIRLGAKLFGGFDPEEWSAIEAVAHCTRPLILIHGEADGFVPCEMSRHLYDACSGKKKLWTVPGADHGLAYPTDPEGYLQVLTEFQQECGF